MRNADDEDLKRRLTQALDKVQPPYSTPRYMTWRPRSLGWRLLPAAVAAAALSALVVSVYAGTATGSPDPNVWTKTVVNVFAPPPAAPETAPTKPPATHPPTAHPPTQRPAPPRESPEPRESPDAHESTGVSSDSRDSGR